jgi:hypothetical protein
MKSMYQNINYKAMTIQNLKSTELNELVGGIYSINYTYDMRDNINESAGCCCTYLNQQGFSNLKCYGV